MSDSHARELALLMEAVRLSADALVHDPGQLPGQLLGRLAAVDAPALAALLAQARASTRSTWLRPVSPTLAAPGGALVMTLRSPTSLLTAAAATPDGSRAVSAAGDGTLVVWDLATGREARRLPSHGSRVRAVALTADGRRCIAGSEDAVFTLWDVDRSTRMLTLELRRNPAVGSVAAVVALTPDGGRAVVATSADDMHIWELDEDRLQHLAGHSYGFVNALVVTADGRRLVSAASDASLKLWDLESGRELLTLGGWSGAFEQTLLMPNGCVIASVGTGKSSGGMQTYGGKDHYRIWDIDAGAEVRVVRGVPGLAAVLPDGDRAISLSEGAIVVWDLDSGARLATLAPRGGALALQVTVDGTRAVSASIDGTLRVWNLRAAAVHASPDAHDDAVDATATSADARRGLSASRDGTLKLWDLTNGRQLRALEGHGSPVMAVAILPDGVRVLTGARDGRLTLWSLADGTELATVEGHPDAVSAVHVTRDGGTALSVGRHVKAWRLEDLTEAFAFGAEQHNIYAVVITADDRRVLSAGGFPHGTPDVARQNSVRVVDLRSGEELRCLLGHRGGVFAVAVTQDGALAVSGSIDGTAMAWDIERGEQLRALRHAEPVYAVALAADGRLAYSASGDGVLKAWEPRTGDERWTATGVRVRVEQTSLQLTRDDRRLVFLAADGSLTVCDAKLGRPLARFTTDAAIVSWTLACDGVTLLAGEHSGRVHVLRIEC
jgi:WD40 repeat protein